MKLCVASGSSGIIVSFLPLLLVRCLFLKRNTNVFDGLFRQPVNCSVKQGRRCAEWGQVL